MLALQCKWLQIYQLYEPNCMMGLWLKTCILIHLPYRKMIISRLFLLQSYNPVEDIACTIAKQGVLPLNKLTACSTSICNSHTLLKNVNAIFLTYLKSVVNFQCLNSTLVVFSPWNKWYSHENQPMWGYIFTLLNSLFHYLPYKVCQFQPE